MSVTERAPAATSPGTAGNGAGSSRLSLRDLDRLLAGIGEGGFAADGDGRIVLWNRSAERILGYTSQEVVGKRCTDVFGVSGAGRSGSCAGCHLLFDADAGTHAQVFEMQAITRTGKRVWLGVSVVPASACGNVTMHFFHDATDRRRLSDIVSDRAGRPEADGAARTLSPRELEVLRLLVAGAGTRTAAARLHVSLATVRNHVQSIFRKLEVHSRLEAVAYANRHRLI